jgi:hypothetical protein
MEKWRRVWRDGLAPNLSRAALLALQSALLTDDSRLVQGTLSTPPPLDVLRPCAINGACALGLCGWHGEGLNTIGQVEDYFDRACDAAAAAVDEPAACRHFLNWYDDAARDVMRRQLLAEVKLALQRKVPSAA